MFDFHHTRRVLEMDGSYSTYELKDYALDRWEALNGEGGDLPGHFVHARQLAPEAHLDMQVALQGYVDNAISKTINVPQDYDFEAFRSLYDYAYDHGLKGCTTFRENPVTGAVLISGESERPEGAHAPHCCSIEREVD